MDAPTFRIEPELSRWELSHPFRLDPDAAKLREQLGLPTDRPLILTGHQPMFWHPGVLAKYVTARIAAERLDARAAWLVVDHDLADAETAVVRYPSRAADGRLTPAAWTLSRVDPVTPACVAPPVAPEPPAEPPAAPHVADGLRRMREALLEFRAAPSLAEQIDHAQRAMLARELGLAPDAVVLASRLSRTAFFARLVDRMRRDPAACASAYNAAVDAHPDARLARLGGIDGQPELPLWIMPEDAGPRTPASAGDLADPARLAPRALMLTACLRLAACELFIHGVGGSRYDAATEDWIGRWLGLPLAPRALVTATLRLPLDADPLPDQAAVRRAAERAHKARHDPALVGDTQAADQRARLVESIARAKKSGQDASAQFAELQTLLADYRRRRADDLAALDAEVERLTTRAGDARILDDRTWAWPLFPAKTLEALGS